LAGLRNYFRGKESTLLAILQKYDVTKKGFLVDSDLRVILYDYGLMENDNIEFVEIIKRMNGNASNQIDLIDLARKVEALGRPTR
jgi:sulfur carrier protein ThiS